MHPNPIFRSESEARALDLARDRALGTLAVNHDGGPLLSHVPFLLAEDGARADLHLVRSNPIARLGSVEAVIAVQGPDAYVSPDWYGIEDQVPTWNYVAIHLRGRLEPLPPETMPDLLARQSAAYESRLAPKTPWTMDKMSDEVLTRFLRMILPFRLTIERIDSTFKLGQNKAEEVRHAAADRLAEGFGVEVGALSRLMREG
ncbi:FMN-binding negative transcriptional regulator [Pelagovum pacificum]|uniref:FMN-binding negative transcriptional regulator n=1 Tax=Pelagovum pacificum TaxID=2588711 RepID=A0A5C5GGW3_9RHOB|nr:FMN-binding negative transcriptional regulator [Pelagovum pacificum]QQA43047.1 FMN-binding negative transcriptional regulator [Pelagovum pacificum]TNY33810.1 FMN-binding negative transcriptional regulator [Pelagovum pacificum]